MGQILGRTAFLANPNPRVRVRVRIRARFGLGLVRATFLAPPASAIEGCAAILFLISPA